MIHLQQIFKSFGDTEVLKGISVEVKRGEVVAITGPSGAGKTTLLQIIGTLEPTDSGEVTLNGVSLSQLSGKKLAVFRNKNLGFVFQFHRLLPEFSALENILLPTWIGGAGKKQYETKALSLMEKLGISHCRDKKPAEMSGGENQRTAVARALINDPVILLADEPSGSLDTENAVALHELFLSLRNDLGITIVIVTHNKQLAEMSDRIVRIENGSLVS